MIGSLSSLLTIWLQAKAGARAERIKQAVQLAIDDHKAAVQIATSRASGTVWLPPIVAFLHYHNEVLEALSRNALTPDELKRIREKNKEVLKITEASLEKENKVRENAVSGADGNPGCR